MGTFGLLDYKYTFRFIYLSIVLVTVIYLYLYSLYACTCIAIPFLTKLWQTVFQVVFVSQKISASRYRHPNVFVIGDDRYILEVLGDISYRISLLNKNMRRISRTCLHSLTGWTPHIHLTSQPVIARRWVGWRRFGHDPCFHLWAEITHRPEGLTNHQGEKSREPETKKMKIWTKGRWSFFFWGYFWIFLVCEWVFSIYENRIPWENLAWCFLSHTFCFSMFPLLKILNHFQLKTSRV